MLFLGFLAGWLIVLIRSIGQGKIGSAITATIASVFHLSWNEALLIYFNVVRNNIDFLMLGAMLIVFLLFMRIFLSWFTRYFDEIIKGVYQLAEGKKISMPPELDFVSRQLKKVDAMLKKSDAEKRRAEQRKNDLLAYLAHDIKTPLTSVIGYLSLLDEGGGLDGKQKKYVSVALKKSFRLETLVNELFEIARYNLDDMPLFKETINLSYMIYQLADEAYPILQENGKTAEVSIPDGLTLYADPDKMARVFHNLLKNAIFYSDAGSKIEITAAREGGKSVIRFANAGSIPREKLALIFDKFYRLDEARQSATGGAGLGLAIAKDIVLLHGGTISAKSEGGRTEFVVSLPEQTENPVSTLSENKGT